MVKKHFTVIAYDIVSNRRRTRVADLLSLYGDRANKSVFECLLSETQMQKLRPKLEKAIDPTKDSVLIYRVCKACFVQSERIGLGGSPPPMIHSV